MSADVGRRVFVGSVVAGVPLLVAGGTRLAWAQRQATGSRVKDPVVDQLLVEMKRSVRALSKGSSGEHTRRLASSLRLLAAWGGANQLDVRVKDTLRSVVAREGRQALLRRNVDRAMFRAEAREFGFDGTSAVPLPEFPAPDGAARERAVNALLAGDVTAQWKKSADTLDAIAAALDRQAFRQVPGATLVAQVDPAYCGMIRQQLEYLSVQMIFWCAPWFWWVPEPCGLATSAYLGVYAGGWWRGC